MKHKKNFDLDKMMDFIDEIVWAFNKETGTLIFCNSAYEKIWGNTLSELKKNPHTWRNNIDPEYLALVNEAILNLETSKSFNIEYKIRRTDGSIRWVRDKRWVDNDKILGSVQDITEIKSINKELLNIVYAASHDLREPLRIINGYAYMIESVSESLPTTFKYYIEHIVNASKRMAEMIDGLLAYSHITREDEFKEINLRTLIGLATENLKRTIKETGAIICIKDSAMIYGNRGQLIQLFQNLISNAIKFSKDSLIPRIEVGLISADSNQYTIYVKDNGIGIREENFEKVFNLFKKMHTEEVYPGRGIGLSIVKQIVEHHSGHIWVKSKQGKGTTFCFSLPKDIHNESS